MHLVLQPLSMSSSITLCLHPPLLSGPPASHSSRLSEKLSPSKTLQMLSVCGGFHHRGERGLHCRASNSSVFARQRLPLLKKNPPKQLFNDRGSECVLMHVKHSVFLFMCVRVLPSSFSCPPHANSSTWCTVHQQIHISTLVAVQ